MQIKLHINITEGVIDVEGDSDLVRQVYSDFKERLLKGLADVPTPKSESGQAASGRAARSRRTGSSKNSSSGRKAASEDGSSVSADAPKLDKDLDTSTLAAFYRDIEARNHPEKILVFLTFLTEKLEIGAPNTDQVYTCYKAAGERLPKAFGQAFRDTSGSRFGYINYKSPTDLTITLNGQNHFKLDIKRKSAE